MSKKIVIIGSGIGGLALANLLAKSGFKVEVYEKNDYLGGRVAVLQKDGFTFDMGPSWYLMPKVFEHYFDLLEKKSSDYYDLIKLDPCYKVFFEDHSSINITGNLAEDSQTFDNLEINAGAGLKQYVSKSKKIYDLAVKHFLYSNFEHKSDLLNREVIANSIQMINLSFTSVHRYIQRYVKNPKLQKILEYPMVFLGTSPFSAPALYSLMSALDFDEGVFYPTGGFTAITDSLVKIGRELDVKYLTDSPVNKIIVNNNQATGITLENGKIIKADIIVSNADLYFTENKLLEPKLRTYPKSYWNKKEASPSAILIYLGLKGKIKELTHHNLLLVNDWQANFNDIFKKKVIPKRASIYICKPSQTDSTVAPKNHENIFILVPITPGISLSHSELEQLSNRYINQIEKAIKIDIRTKVVSRSYFGPDDFKNKFNSWQSSMLGPSHILKQSAFFRASNKSKKVKNLYYVGGGTTPGIGLPMCLISAELAYKRILGIKKGGPEKKV